MLRLFLLVLCLLACQSPGFAAGPAPAAAPAGAPPAITADQARAALDVLNDPQKRAAFQATLRAIVDGAPTPAQTPAAAPSPAPDVRVAPHSLGAQLLYRVNATTNQLRHRIESAAASVQSVPLLWAWLVVMATDPVGQEIVWGVGWRLLLAIAAATSAGWIVRRLLRPASRRLDAAALAQWEDPVDRAERGDTDEESPAVKEPLGVGRRHWLILPRLGLRLLPVLALLATGHIVALAVGGDTAGGLVIEAVAEAVAAILIVIVLARILLDPDDARLRPVPLADPVAAYTLRWTCRLTITAIGGYATAEVGVLLGLSNPGHDAILGLTGLLLTAGLIFMILTLRRPLRRALRAPSEATGIVAALRNGFARIWHWLALLALATVWFSWAVEISVTGPEILSTIGSIALVLIVARVVLMLMGRLVARLVTISEHAGRRYPGLEERVRFYHPALTGTLRITVHVLTLLALLQVLGTDSLSWLWTTHAGQRVMAGLITLAVTILATVIVWELVNAAIQRHLNRLQQEAQLARSARLRTLLPMLRTSLLVVISVVAVLMVLSEIGVDIAPLLAGAGILGVAIGFGSQKLVQDLITGIFLLLENAMQVGDFVNVAGLSGSVEGLSIRTMRLRAADGALHIVPFSSVSTVTNHTRGRGNAEVRATVDFTADTDAVAQIMADIVAEMRTEPEYELKILQDFQLWGVDRIDVSGVTILGQVACTDSGRWSVQREINRRIKQRFDAAGIRFFNPAAPPMLTS